MFTRIFLGFSGLAWLGYGIFCLVSPQQLATVAGVAAQMSSGTTELRAMYGGTQSAIGLAVLWGALRAQSSRWSLQFQAVIYGGVVPARLVSALATGDHSSYTVGAVLFELTCLIVTLLLLRASPKASGFEPA